MLRRAFQGLGGPDALSWITAVVVYPTALLFTLFGSGIELQGDALLRLTVASIVSNTCMLLFIFFAQRLLLSQGSRNAPHPWWMLAAILGGLVVRAAVIDQLVMWLGLHEQSRFWFRFFASLPSTGGMIVIIAVVVSLSREYSRSLSRLDRAKRSFELLTTQHEVIVEEERKQVIALARTSLDERLRELSGEASTESLERVRKAIEDVVRPLSHQLNDPLARNIQLPEAIDEPVGWRVVVKDFFGEKSIHPLWFTLWSAVTGLLYAPQLWGLQVGLMFVLHITIVTGISTLLIRLVWDRFFASRNWRIRATVFSVFCVMVGGLYGFGSAALNPLFRDRIWLHTIALIAAALVAGWLFTSLSSLIGNLNELTTQLDEVETALRREQVLLNAHLHVEMRALARFLHGPVQDALSVAAFRIRAAIDDDHAPYELVTELRKSIVIAMDDMSDADRSAADTDEVLRQLADLWQGVTEITWQLSHDAAAALDEHTVTRASFNELVRETCSNAVRHGEASHISISASVIDDELTLLVENRGAPVPEHRDPGLGSRLFDELTLSWTIEALPAGSRLTARLPLIR